MIHIPDLRQFSFHEASFDLVLEDCSDLDDESATRYGEQPPIALFCDSHGGQIITLDVAFGSATEDGNSLLATLQLSRYWDWELERDREEATLDQLKYEINTLPRMKWRIYMQASYSVPREMLPARGIVSEMIGLQTRVRRHFPVPCQSVPRAASVLFCTFAPTTISKSQDPTLRCLTQDVLNRRLVGRTKSIRC